MKKTEKILNIIRRNGQKALWTVCVCCAAFGWWGVLYPQFALNEDTYCIVSQDGTVQSEDSAAKWESGDTIYMEILNADSSRIRFRSKLLKEFSGLWEILRGEEKEQPDQ